MMIGDREGGDGYESVPLVDQDGDLHAVMTPVMTALMHRQDGLGQTEVLWLNLYVYTDEKGKTCKLMVEAIPAVEHPVAGHQSGVVMEWPIGRKVWAEDAFQSRISLRAQGGWREVSCSVWSGDPWDTPSVLDKEADF